MRKELRKGFGDGDLWAEAGSDEHQIMSYLYHLEHPNILPLLTSYTYNGIPNFLLPLAEGGDLEHLLTQNGRPTDFSRNAQFYGAMSGLASGLQTLHEYKSDVLGIEMIGYHHDLKPKNILVYKGRLILSDFGLSKLKTAEDSRTPFKMGQGHYLAPECEDPELDFSKGIVSRASDVWSLGCILLEILIFMAEGGDSLTQFRESRSVKQGFLTTRTFFHKRSLNPAVDRKLNEMANSHDDLISKSVALIRQMLVVQLEERLKASQITLSFSAISFEACYLTLNAAFRSVKWRVDDTETIMEWEKFRHLAGLLITRDHTTTNFDPRIKQSRFFADRSQVESLHDIMNRTISFLDDPNPLNEFAAKLTSQLKQLTTLLELRVSEIQCDEASTPAEVNSLHHAAHEPINVEQVNKLGWTDSILTVPITKVRNAIVSSNEKFLAVEDNRSITIYALPSGNKVQTIRESADKEWLFNFPKFAFAPNGENLLVCWRSHLCSYHVQNGGSGFDILFPPLTERDGYRFATRSENMMKPILTGVAAVSTDSKHVAFGVTRRRPTLSDSFEELIFIVSLTAEGKVRGPPTQASVGNFDCVAGFSPDNRQLAVGSQRSTLHKGKNYIRIRLVNHYTNDTDQNIIQWATTSCDEKFDKGRRAWMEPWDVVVRYPRRAFTSWDDRWVAALWEKSKRTLILHDLHSRTQQASIDLFPSESFDLEIEKTIFSANLKFAATLQNPARAILGKFGLGKVKSIDNEVVCVDVKNGKVVCSLAAGKFDEYWLSNSGQYIAMRKKRELRIFCLQNP